MLRRIIEASTEGRSVVGVVSGGIGDQVIAPVIEDSPVRVGEAVGDVGFEAASGWLEAEDRRVVVAKRTVRRFDLGAMENAVA